jgi:hypothetical protein
LSLFAAFLTVALTVLSQAIVFYGAFQDMRGRPFSLADGPAGSFGAAATQTIGLIWDAIWTAFFAVVMVVTYHDLRVAREGVDTEQIAAVFE